MSRIPKSFELFGHTINVSKNNRLNKDTGLWGVSKYSAKEILLDSDLQENLKEQTFYHELIHSILEHMGENKLSDDEKFVNTFSELLYQFIITSKYE